MSIVPSVIQAYCAQRPQKSKKPSKARFFSKWVDKEQGFPNKWLWA